MDLTSETLNYSAFDIQCEFFPGDNCLYDFDSKENDKHFPDVNFSTAFESTTMDEKFRQSNFFEGDVGSPLFNNYNDHPSKVASTNRQYYAYRTSQFQPGRFESDESSAQSESSSTNQDLSSTNSISRVFVCSYCNKSFTSEKYLSMHVSLHNLPNAGGESNSAQLIVQEFKSQGICPIERTKAKGNSKAASWTCKICLKTFAQNSNYKNHIRTHSNERPFVCNICSIGFKERYHLKKHNLFVHTSEMKEDCKICGKRFKDSTAVRAHERTHSDLRPYVCLRCNKAFKTSECLWHHENRSKACVKNYLKNSPGSDLKIESKKIKVDRPERKKESSCEALDKDSRETFPSKSTQNSHKYVKMEQNSSFYSNQTVVSQPCSQQCSTSEPLLSENNSMYHNFGIGHNNVYGSAEQMENLSCIQCGKSFESNSSTQVADRPQHCVECNASFRSKDHLNKGNLHKRMEKPVKLHERNQTDLGPFKCRCGKSFKTRDNLWRHQQRGLCEFSYELSIMQEAGLTVNWQSSDSEYFGAKTDHSSHKQSLIPSQEVITDRSSALNAGEQSREREATSLQRGDSTWKMVGAGSKQVAAAISAEQHPVIPTAIVVPMKRIPSNMFTQQVISPHKKPVDNAFLPPFETFNDAIPTEGMHHTIGIGNTNPEGNHQYHSKPNFQQKLPDIQCMLQSFPQSYSFQISNSLSNDLIRQSNVVDSQRHFGSTCYQKQPGFANQVAYTNHTVEDFRYNNQFSISYNF